jgi:hypothetical protein
MRENKLAHQERNGPNRPEDQERLQRSVMSFLCSANDAVESARRLHHSILALELQNATARREERIPAASRVIIKFWRCFCACGMSASAYQALRVGERSASVTP